MNVGYFPELASLFPLALAILLLWRERKKFNSLLPFIFGISLILAARSIDVITEHPSILPSKLLGVERSSFSSLLEVVSDFCDAGGVLYLVIGFVRTIRFVHEEEQRIQDLETLLPICSNCKRIRSNDNVWEPVEKYLIEGNRKLTHGICPECSEKVYGQLSFR